MIYDIHKFIDLIDNFHKNNARIKQLDEMVNYRNVVGLNCENLISEINQLYKLNTEIQSDIKKFDLSLNDKEFNIEKYVELNQKLSLNDDRLKELDGLINMRKALGSDCSVYIDEYNKLLQENKNINEQTVLYDIQISKDNANLIYNRYLSKQKIYALGKDISNNIGNDFGKVIELINDARKEIDNFKNIENEIEKQYNSERVGVLSEKRHNARKLEDLKVLLKEKNLLLQSLNPGTYEFLKCNNIIKDLEKDYKTTEEILEKINKKESNLIGLENIDKSLISTKQQVVQQPEQKLEQQAVKPKVNNRDLFKDYRMDGSKLDNIEKYGVNFTPKELKPIKIEEPTPILEERAKNITKIFTKIKNFAKEKLEQISEDMYLYNDDSINYRRSR